MRNRAVASVTTTRAQAISMTASVARDRGSRKDQTGLHHPTGDDDAAALRQSPPLARSPRES
jgi:hypothetical protein